LDAGNLVARGRRRGRSIEVHFRD